MSAELQADLIMLLKLPFLPKYVLSFSHRQQWHVQLSLDSLQGKKRCLKCIHTAADTQN